MYPTDLLKAFHLREIHRSDEKKLEMSELWENIKPNHIHILFSEYLYRIKKWSKNKDVSAWGFSNYDIDLFKGISEGNKNDELNWAKSILMAKNFVDNFNSQNQVMIDFNILPKMNYAFQIDQPIINGEYFFKYVAHYNSLLDKHGFYSDVENENSILSLYVKKAIGPISNMFNHYLKRRCSTHLINFQIVIMNCLRMYVLSIRTFLGFTWNKYRRKVSINLL